MKFAILAYESPAEFEARNDAAQCGRYWGEWAAFGQSLKMAGIVSAMHGFGQPALARTIRVAAGKAAIETGPMQATTPQLGGYFIIEVAAEEEAVNWAAKCPAARDGAVEIRPLL